MFLDSYSTITPAAILATGATATNLASRTTTAPTQAQIAGARQILLRVPKAATAPVFIGDSTVTSTPGGNVMIDLQPGEALFLNASALQSLWVASAAAQSVYVTMLK